MKLKVLNIISCLFVAACVITSCLDSDDMVYETNYKSSITAFSSIVSLHIIRLLQKRVKTLL